MNNHGLSCPPLTGECKSPWRPPLRGWAQRQARQSRWRTVGIDSGPSGFGCNPESLARRQRPVARGETAVAIRFMHKVPGEQTPIARGEKDVHALPR